MTSLTKKDKERIIRSIMADIPIENDGSNIRSRALEIAVSRLPAKVKALWDDEKLRGYVHTETAYLRGYGSTSIPCDDALPYQERDTHVFGAEGQLELSRMVEEYKAAKEKRDALCDKITVEIGVVRTDKQFRERFPDLAKYLPEIMKTKNPLATTDLMDTLKAAGLNQEAGQ